MKLPLIKHVVQFIEENDEDFVVETLETLEYITEYSGLKDNEIDVLGEVISNLYGALEVQKMIQEGQSIKEALNVFMKRVQRSIDT
ncbi:MAG: DUF6952 family protein [Flavobacteriaceae bacterium]